MVFRNFRLQTIVRVFLLTAVICALSWCVQNGFYLRSIYAAVVVILILIEFIWFVDRFNRDVNSYLTSLMQRDFTTHFQSKGRSKSFNALYETLNRIAHVFKTISAEKEAQHRFLEMLVEHMRVGILTMDEKGKIILANQAVKDLLQKDVLFSLKSFESYGRGLIETLRDIHSGETRLVKVQVSNELLQLSIHAAEFRLEEQYHKLISMQNIRNELDTREMEAWQKLIRVLTHEIMNSVSPIISLSETMHGLVNKNNATLNADKDLYTTLDKGLEAIRIRSEGLYNFTQSYRKLTGIPTINLQKTTTGAILDRVAVLMESKMKDNAIAFRIRNNDAPIAVDPQLMEHVLINLLLNAIAAVATSNNPFVEMGATQSPRGEVKIYVKDNGEGIDESTAEKIFVPFFTTRKDGSGIGLALARQILQLHHANITFISEKGKGTEFVITL